jgi:hypothetical protein
MAYVEGENPFSKTLGKPTSIEGSCPNGSSYKTKPIFQNLKKTHLYMRFLSKWVLLRDKTHFSKSQESLQVQNLHTLMSPFLGRTHLYKNLHPWKRLSIYGTQEHF